VPTAATADHHEPHGHGHHHDGHHHDGALAEVLELDARVLPFAPEVVRRVAGALTRPPADVVDLGAGAGSGSLALAARFPSARLTAVDRSPVMTGRLREAFAAAGLGPRASVVQAEVDGTWTPPGPVDLVWASLVLHEVPDAEAVLAAVRSALRPGGTFAVVEMDAPPRFLPDGAADGLEDRLHAELATVGGRPAHPRWAAALERAGFSGVSEQRVPLEVSAPVDLVRRFAVGYLGLAAPAVRGRLSAADASALDGLLDGPHALSTRSDLVVRASRTLWTAHRP
jgi:SAM-dependent methyltransferase